MRHGKSLIRNLCLLANLLLGIAGCAALKENLDYNRALEDFRKNRLETSEGYIQAALQEKPSDERAISLLGWIRFKEGRTVEARDSFEKAETLNPENPGTIEGLAWIYYGQGKDGEAENKFQKLLEYSQKHLQDPYWGYYSVEDKDFITSVDSDANYGLGLIAKRRGLWLKARAYFERALNQFNQYIPREPITRELADTLFEIGEYRLAMVQYRDLIPYSPQDFSLLNRYAFCLYQTGNMKEAQFYYEQAKKIISSTAKYYSQYKGVKSLTQKLYAKRIAECYYGLSLMDGKERRLEAARENLAFALKISPYFHHPDEVVQLFQQHVLRHWMLNEYP
jgi:tetratricopeptide (TPR) repeat protein